MSEQPSKKYASLSLDLDNLWSYLKIHGDESWKSYPSYFNIFIPRFLDFLQQHHIKTTVFIIGRDAAREENKIWMEKIAKDEHEFGNHSFNHEPWMEELSTAKITEELIQSHNAIENATGKAPIGFRGPGFCCNEKLLEAVRNLNYTFDASLMPTTIAPLARLYYFLTLNSLKAKDRSKRKYLFGKMKNCLMPIKPFNWDLPSGKLLEIPVTTIPLLRLPFHLSYIMWLSKFSEVVAINYFNTALSLCNRLDIEPSILLHPLDFLGREDVEGLSFFPGMDLSRDHKLSIAHKAISSLTDKFEVIPMSRHAEVILKRM